MALSIPSVPFIPPPPRVFVILFWKSCKCLTVGPGIQTKTSRVWSLKKCANPPPQDNTKILGHFRVPKTLTYKMRLGAQPFLWKRVLFAWEWNMISVSKAEHLPWYWNRGPGELENVLLLHFWHQNGAQFSRWLQLILIWKVSTQPQFESESFLIRSQGFLHALLGTRLWGFSRN